MRYPEFQALPRPAGAASITDRYDELFPDDRVQTVRVVMEEEKWTSMLANAQAEEYYQADIWIDGEQV